MAKVTQIKRVYRKTKVAATTNKTRKRRKKTSGKKNA